MKKVETLKTKRFEWHLYKMAVSLEN